MKLQKFILVIVLTFPVASFFARTVPLQDVACLNMSDLILKATVVTTDSVTVRLKVLKTVKGETKDSFITVSKLWETSCIGRGSYSDYNVNDTIIAFLKKEKRKYEIIKETGVENGFVNSFYRDQTAEGKPDYYEHTITDLAYMKMIKDFFRVFEFRKRKSAGDNVASGRKIKHFVITDKKLYNEFVQRSRFHKELAEEALDYTEEVNLFGKRQRQKF